MKQNNHKVVIFDFDGTLADGVKIMLEIYSAEAVARGWPAMSQGEYKKLRKGTIKDAMKWVGIKPWQIPGILKSGRTRFHQYSGNLPLFEGIPEVIKTLHDNGWDIYILSSNSAHTIHKVLRRYNLDNLVHILKRPALFSKATSINRLIKKHGYNKSMVWMVGDEVRDIEAGNSAGVRTIGVFWGLQDICILKKYKPTHLVNRPSDITKILGSNLNA